MLRPSLKRPNLSWRGRSEIRKSISGSPHNTGPLVSTEDLTILHFRTASMQVSTLSPSRPDYRTSPHSSTDRRTDERTPSNHFIKIRSNSSGVSHWAKTPPGLEPWSTYKNLKKTSIVRQNELVIIDQKPPAEFLTQVPKITDILTSKTWTCQWAPAIGVHQ
jgi:hypothetical protein